MSLSSSHLGFASKVKHRHFPSLPLFLRLCFAVGSEVKAILDKTSGIFVVLVSGTVLLLSLFFIV